MRTMIARRAPPPSPTPRPIASALLCLLSVTLVVADCVLCETSGTDVDVVVKAGAAALGVEKL